MKGKKKQQQKKSMWKPEEDMLLKKYVQAHGEGKWSAIPKKLGLMRDGKSCRLRWKNYLRPDIKHGSMSKDEQDLIIRMHKLIGNRWSLIAGRLPGRTDNEVKNYWNTHLSKNSSTKRKPITSLKPNSGSKKPRAADFERIESAAGETLKIISIGEDHYSKLSSGQIDSKDEEERWSSLTEEMLVTRSGAGGLTEGLVGMRWMYGEDEEEMMWPTSAAWGHAGCVWLDAFGVADM